MTCLKTTARTLGAAALLAASVSAAKAAPQSAWYDLSWLGAIKPTSPVVASEREFSFTGEGMLTNYKEYPIAPLARKRELGWTPGGTVRASDIFNLYRLKGLYAAGQFDFDLGTTPTQETYHLVNNARTAGTFYSNTSQRKLSGQVELGKAWELTPDLLLITAVQGGYGDWRRGTNSGLGEPFGSSVQSVYVHASPAEFRYGWAGGAVHLDYAITPRLVAKLTGDIGESFDGRMTSTNTPATFYLGDRLRLEGGLTADYRVTTRLHVLASVDYQQFGFGRSPNARAPGVTTYYEPTSQTQQLHLGAGIGLGF